jgi:hypothetical protein
LVAFFAVNPASKLFRPSVVFGVGFGGGEDAGQVRFKKFEHELNILVLTMWERAAQGAKGKIFSD